MPRENLAKPCRKPTGFGRQVPIMPLANVNTADHPAGPVGPIGRSVGPVGPVKTITKEKVAKKVITPKPVKTPVKTSTIKTIKKTQHVQKGIQRIVVDNPPPVLVNTKRPQTIQPLQPQQVQQPQQPKTNKKLNTVKENVSKTVKSNVPKTSLVTSPILIPTSSKSPNPVPKQISEQKKKIDDRIHQAEQRRQRRLKLQMKQIENQTGLKVKII